jgi:ribose transport system permease protein
VSATSAAEPTTTLTRRGTLDRLFRRHGWTVGVVLLLLGLTLYWRSQTTVRWGPFDVQSLVIDALPLAFAACGQAVVIISGGIDLSIGSMMALVNVVSAKYMQHMSFDEALLFSVALVAAGALAGALTGLTIVVTRVADIIVTLAMLFVWGGVALAVLEVPGGGVPPRYGSLITVDTVHTAWLPTALLILGGAYALLWLTVRRARPGLELYAVGSNRNAAYLAGVNVSRARILAYAYAGGFAALGGLALSAASGLGDPNSGGIYTLNSVAAVVLGGVSLLGGVGGLIGPIVAAFVLTLVKTLMIIKGVDQNYAQVIQGSLIVLVVMIGGLAIRQKAKGS